MNKLILLGLLFLCVGFASATMTPIATYTGGITTAPVLNGGFLYFGNGNDVVKINATTMAFVNSYTTPSNFYRGTPFVSGNYVYITGGNTVYKILTSTMTLNATYVGPDTMFSPIVSGSYVYAYCARQGRVHQLNVASMTLANSASVSGYIEGTQSYPMISGGYLYAGHNKLNPTTLAVVQTYSGTNGWINTVPFLKNGFLYLGDSVGGVYKFNESTGTLVASNTNYGATEELFGYGNYIFTNGNTFNIADLSLSDIVSGGYDFSNDSNGMLYYTDGYSTYQYNITSNTVINAMPFGLDFGTRTIFGTGNIAYVPGDVFYEMDTSPVICSSCTEYCSPCGGGCTATDLNNMFYGVTDWSSIGDITHWNTGCISGMSGTFDSSNFNQPIGSWNVGHVTNMYKMFKNAVAFDQDLGSWNTSRVVIADGGLGQMFNGVTLSIDNYDDLLLGWSTNVQHHGLAFDAGNSMYSLTGQSGRDILTNTYGWIITDAGNNESCISDWECTNYNYCDVNDQQVCNGVVDTNHCGPAYTGNYSEFTPLVCDYCTPNWVCTGFGICDINNTELCNAVLDANECVNPIPHIYTGNFSEFTPLSCDFCTPSWTCTGWASCVRPAVNEPCYRVYDNHLCAEPYTGNYSEFTRHDCSYQSSGAGISTDVQSCQILTDSNGHQYTRAGCNATTSQTYTNLAPALSVVPSQKFDIIAWIKGYLPSIQKISDKTKIAAGVIIIGIVGGLYFIRKGKPRRKK